MWIAEVVLALEEHFAIFPRHEVVQRLERHQNFLSLSSLHQHTVHVDGRSDMAEYRKQSVDVQALVGVRSALVKTSETSALLFPENVTN